MVLWPQGAITDSCTVLYDELRLEYGTELKPWQRVGQYSKSQSKRYHHGQPGRIFTLYPLQFTDVKIAFFLEFLQFDLDVRLLFLQGGRSQLEYLVLFVELGHGQAATCRQQITMVNWIMWKFLCETMKHSMLTPLFVFWLMWTMSCLCGGAPDPPLLMAGLLLSVLCTHIMSSSYRSNRFVFVSLGSLHCA